MSYLVTYLNIAPKAVNPHADFPIAIKNAIGKYKHEIVLDLENIKDRLKENNEYIRYKSIKGVYIPDALTFYNPETAEYFDIYGGDFTITGQNTDLTTIEYEVQICIYRIKHDELLTPTIINHPNFQNLFKYDYLIRNNILNMQWHNWRLNDHFINNLHIYENLSKNEYLDMEIIDNILEKSKTKLFSHQKTNLNRMLKITDNPEIIQISNEMLCRFANKLIYEIGSQRFISAEEHKYSISSGMILDEPGTGKTLQFILYILYMLKTGKAKKAMVLVPNDNIKAVWSNEYIKHITPNGNAEHEHELGNTELGNTELGNTELGNTELGNTGLPFEILTFHELSSELYNINDFDIIGIDEIHNLYKCNRPISKFYQDLFTAIVKSKIRYRWGITGTPFVNDSSLYSIIKFLTGQNFVNERVSNDPCIQDQFMPLFLKNRKIDMIDDYIWPEINIHDIRVSLDIVQKRIYDAEVMLNKSDVNKLRQFICNINLMFDKGEFKTPNELKTYGSQHYNNLYESEKVKLQRLKLQLDNIVKHRNDFKSDAEYTARFLHFKDLVDKQETETERHRKVCEYFMTGIEEINKIVQAKIASKHKESGDTSNGDTDCNNEDDKTCLICWSEYSLPISYFKQCGHYFCASCVDCMWGANNTINCPMCRRETHKGDTINVNTMSEINDSSKIHALFDIIKPGEKYIIFTQFDSVITRIQHYLSGRGILSAAMNQYTDQQILILSSQQNAEGINLSHFDKMIIFEPFEANVYAREVERQLIARIHRVGRTRTVDVYRLITIGTVEEEIYSYY